MKVIFVSGPYRGQDWVEVDNHIRRAREAAVKLWRDGWAVICPHSNTSHFDGLCPDEVWLEGDLEILKRCDAIYMLKDWRASKGAKAELDLASKNGLEIIFEERF